MNDDGAPTPAGGHLTDPVTAISRLRAALSDRDITSTWTKAVDERTTMLIAGRQIVLCRDQWFWWATGRFREGRTITGAHPTADPAGAARRLADLESTRTPRK